MAQTKTERVPIMFDKHLLEQVDGYRFENRIGTRSETIRQLLAQSLANKGVNEKGEATA